MELRQKPADPNISHLRKYSREAETSYLNARQRSERHGRDHQIATSPDTAIEQRERDAESRKQLTAKSSQSIDRLTIAIKPIADDLQRLTRQANAFLKRLREQRLFKQLQAKLNKPHRRYPSRRRRGRER